MFSASTTRLSTRGYHEVSILDTDGAAKMTSLLMPFQAGHNPFGEAARRRNFEWLIRMGVMDFGDESCIGIEKAAFHRLASLVYTTEDESSLSVITDFITFLFLFDDMVDCASSCLGTNADLVSHVGEMLMMGVLGQPAYPNGAEHLPIPPRQRRKILGLQNALADLTERLTHIAGSSEALEHYIESMTDYFDGNVKEARLRQGLSDPNLSEYATLRLAVSAVYPCLEIGALLRGISLPNAVRQDPAFRRMRQDCNLSVSYINDLFSYRKETLAGETSNLVHVLKVARGVGTQMALDSAAEIANDMVESYLNVALEGQWDEATAQYMELMESWMRGNMDWYLAVKDRYCDVSSTDLLSPVAYTNPSSLGHALEA